MSIKDLLNARLKEAQPQRDTATRDSVVTPPADSLVNKKPLADSTLTKTDSATQVTGDSTVAQRVAGILYCQGRI